MSEIEEHAPTPAQALAVVRRLVLAEIGEVERLTRENNAYRQLLGQLRASRQYDMSPEQWDTAIEEALNGYDNP